MECSKTGLKLTMPDNYTSNIELKNLRQAETSGTTDDVFSTMLAFDNGHPMGYGLPSLFHEAQKRP